MAADSFFPMIVMYEESLYRSGNLDRPTRFELVGYEKLPIGESFKIILTRATPKQLELVETIYERIQ